MGLDDEMPDAFDDWVANMEADDWIKFGDEFSARSQQDAFNQLGKHKITLIRWDDDWKHWRLGLDWKNENDYEYLVERPTVAECVKYAIEYVKESKNK